MPAVIGALRAELSAGLAGWAGDMTKAGSYVDKFAAKFKGLDRVLPGVSKGIAGFARSLFSVQGIVATLAGTSGIGLLVKNALDTADALVKTADAAGVSTAFLQEMRFAAKQSGLSVEQFEAALTGLTKRVGELRAGKGDLLAILKKLDAGLLQQVRTAGSTEDAYNLITAAAGRFGNASERNAFLAAAFGRTTGVVMANLIKDQTKLRQQARDLGLVFDEEMIRKAEASGDKISALYQMLSARVTVAILENAGSIDRLAEALTKLAGILLRHADTFASAIGGGILGFLIGGGPAALGGAGISLILSELDKINQLLEARAKLTSTMVTRLKNLNEQIAELEKPTTRSRQVVNQDLLRQLEHERALLIAEFEKSQMPNVTVRDKPAGAAGDLGFNAGGEDVAKKREQGIVLLQAMVTKLNEEAQVLGVVAGARDALKDKLEAESIAREHGIKVQDADFQAILAQIQGERAALDTLKTAEEAEAEAKKHQKEIEAEWGQVVAANRTPLETYNAQIAELNRLRAESIALGADAAAVEETYGRAVDQARKVLEDADGTTERLRRAEDAGRDFGRTLAAGMHEAAQSFENLGDVAENILNKIADMLYEMLVAKPLEDFLGGLTKDFVSSYGGGGGWGAGLASLFGGMASGGHVMAHHSYITGEQGMELFTPNSSGTIAPAGSWGGPMIGSVNIQTPDAPSFARSRMEVANAIGDAATIAQVRGR